MLRAPLVSILMTAYNRVQFIEEAIESVLSSGYQNWELIIVDDCSIDQTFEIAKGYAEKDYRIQVHKNKDNLGDYPNRNQAASYAQGEFIVIVDSDDRILADTLEKWVTLMLHHDTSFGIFAHTTYKEPVVLTPARIIHTHFFEQPVLSFGPIATIIKTAYFKSIKGFPLLYGPANDMYYNLKAASNTNTLVFPFPLVDYRIHDGQEFNNKYSYLYNNYRYLRDALAQLDLGLTRKRKRFLEKKNKRRFLLNTIRYYLKNRDWEKTRTAIKLADFSFKDAIVAIFQK